MKKYSHLVFDIDGTMIDSLPVYMVSLKKDAAGLDFV